MPQLVKFNLPIVISGDDDLPIARAIGFADIAVTGSSTDAAVRRLVALVRQRAKDFIGRSLATALVRGKPELQSITIGFAPEKEDQRHEDQHKNDQRNIQWRFPIDVDFHVYRWQQDDSLEIGFVPALDLTIVATPHTDLDRLIDEQIRSAVRRRNLWTIGGLTSLQCTDVTDLTEETIDVSLRTPAEIARGDQGQPQQRDCPTLRGVATRIHPKAVKPALFREAEVEQLDRILSADRPAWARLNWLAVLRSICLGKVNRINRRWSVWT